MKVDTFLLIFDYEVISFIRIYDDTINSKHSHILLDIYIYRYLIITCDTCSKYMTMNVDKYVRD